MVIAGFPMKLQEKLTIGELVWFDYQIKHKNCNSEGPGANGLHITQVLKDFEPHHESMSRVEGWVGGGFMCVHLRSLQLFGVAGGGNIHLQKVTRVGLGKA